MVALDAGAATVIGSMLGLAGVIFSVLFVARPARRAARDSKETRNAIANGQAMHTDSHAVLGGEIREFKHELRDTLDDFKRETRGNFERVERRIVQVESKLDLDHTLARHVVPGAGDD